MKRPPMKEVYRQGAMRWLDFCVHDILLGATLWDDVLPVERRFNLKGYTINKVCWLEDTREFEQALARYERLTAQPYRDADDQFRRERAVREMHYRAHHRPDLAARIP